MKRSGSSHINYHEIVIQNGLNESMDLEKKKNVQSDWHLERAWIWFQKFYLFPSDSKQRNERAKN